MTFDINDTTFVSIDIQPREKDRVWTWENRMPDWVKSGFTPEELNDAERHFHETMLPNALKMASFAAERDLPRVFVHWAEGTVHGSFDLAPEDHIIPKTKMDAFISSNIAEVLESIGRRTLFMVGGHTQGCLGRTATSALAAGYTCICVRDATYDCSYIRWPKGIAAVDYHAVVDTVEVPALFA